MQVMAAAVEDTDKSLREIDSEEFHPFLEGAGEKLVIVDFYTDWYIIHPNFLCTTFPWNLPGKS